VPAYVRGLADAARVPLEPVLHWAGLGLDEPLGATFAHGWSRLARALGLGVREALWHLRLTFAEKVGLAVPALAARLEPGPGLDTFATAREAVVNSAVAGWDAAVRSQLRSCEQVVRDAYAAADAAETPLS
jgi:hypothetical protein